MPFKKTTILVAAFVATSIASAQNEPGVLGRVREISGGDARILARGFELAAQDGCQERTTVQEEFFCDLSAIAKALDEHSTHTKLQFLELCGGSTYAERVYGSSRTKIGLKLVEEVPVIVSVRGGCDASETLGAFRQ